MPEQYNGLVIGGLYDAHFSPQYNVGIASLPPLSFVGEKSQSADVTMDVFTYHPYSYVDASFWIPIQVIRGEMFDYHHYSHPMEYIMKKLSDGYNPIAKR